MAETTFHSITLPGQNTARVPLTAVEFSTSTAYNIRDYCTYQGKLYKCTTTHAAGAWNASHFTEVNIGDQINTRLVVPSTTEPPLAERRVGDLWVDTSTSTPVVNVDPAPIPGSSNLPQSGGTYNLIKTEVSDKVKKALLTGVFSTASSYSVNDLCIYNDKLYRCITDIPSPAAWDASKWQETTIADQLKRIESVDTDLGVIAENFGDSLSYNVGECVIHVENNEHKLYKCKSAVSNTSVWNELYWDEIKLANNVSELKNSVNNNITNTYKVLYEPTFNILSGGINISTGDDNTNTTRAKTQYFSVKKGHSYLFKLVDNKYGIDTAWLYTSQEASGATRAATKIDYQTYIFTPINNETQFRASFLLSSNKAHIFTTQERAEIKTKIIITELTDEELKISGAPADAKAVDEKIKSAIETIYTDLGIIAENFGDSPIYKVGDYVIHIEDEEYKLYKCKSAVNNTSVWNELYWDEIKLADSVKDLENSLYDVTQNKPIKFILNKYLITSGSIGTTVDFSDIRASSNGSRYSVIDVSEGDSFVLFGKGGNNGRLWCWVDSENKILSHAAADISADGLVIYAPKNATKLIVHTNITDGNSYYNELLSTKIEDIYKIIERDGIEFQKFTSSIGGGMSYNFNFIIGNTYKIYNESESGTVNISTRNNDTTAESVIQGLGAGESCTFIPTVNANIFRVYYNNDVDNHIFILYGDKFNNKELDKVVEYIAPESVQGTNSNKSDFKYNSETRVQDVYNWFLNLTETFNHDFVKVQLGTSSTPTGDNISIDPNTYPINAYILTGKKYIQGNDFIIDSGIHGPNWEDGDGVISVVSVCYFIKDLLLYYTKNPYLSYIRDYCKVLVVPLLNPWGYQNAKRQNGRGIDCNRNFDFVFTPGAGGQTAFSENESRLYAQYIQNNFNNAKFCIDLHTRGTGMLPTDDKRWLIRPTATDTTSIAAATETANYVKYRFGGATYISPESSTEFKPNTRAYIDQVLHIPTSLIECACGFGPNADVTTRHSDLVVKSYTTLLGSLVQNYLKTYIMN